MKNLVSLLSSLFLLSGCGAKGIAPSDIPYAFVLFEPAEIPSKEETNPTKRIEMLATHWGSYIFYEPTGEIRWRVQGPKGVMSPDGRKVIYVGPDGPTVHDLFTRRKTVLINTDSSGLNNDLRLGFSGNGKYAFFGTGKTDFKKGPIIRELVRYNLELGKESGRFRFIDIPEITPEQGAFITQICSHDPGELTLSIDGRYAFTLAWNPLATDPDVFLEPVASLEIPMGNFLYETYFDLYRIDFETGQAFKLTELEMGSLWVPPIFYDDSSETLYLAQRSISSDRQNYKIKAVGPDGDELEILSSNDGLHLMGLSTNKTSLAYYVISKLDTGLVKKSYGVIDLRSYEPEIYFDLPVGMIEVEFGPEHQWAAYISLAKYGWEEIHSYLAPQGPKPYLHLVEFPSGRDTVLFSTDTPGKDLEAIIPLAALP
jgi:hypothetical protein